MSIELDVKVGAVVPNSKLERETEALLGRSFSDHPDVEWHQASGALGEAASSGRASIGAAAEIELLCYWSGMASSGDEGGWWVSVAVAQRSPESVMLMVVVAAAFAALTGCPVVVDEAELLGLGRVVQAQEILDSLLRSGRVSFADAARERFASLTPA
jgi:hypothetical protein